VHFLMLGNARGGISQEEENRPAGNGEGEARKKIRRGKGECETRKNILRGKKTERAKNGKRQMAYSSRRERKNGSIYSSRAGKPFWEVRRRTIATMCRKRHFFRGKAS
jgi:hypothetical protein